MSEPPRADIVLLRRDTETWTEEQYTLLADGIRDCYAKHLLLEFKYTESITDEAFQQVLGYEFFYRQSQSLHPNAIQCFLLSAKTPLTKTLQRFGYTEEQHRGVYQSNLPLLENVTLLVLNDLQNTTNNSWLKLFASRRQQKQQAATLLQDAGTAQRNYRLYNFLNGLSNIFFLDQEERIMALDIRPEDVSEFGRIFIPAGVKFWTDEEKMQVLSQLKPEERLQGLKPEERLQGLDTEQQQVLLQLLLKNTGSTDQ